MRYFTVEASHAAANTVSFVVTLPQPPEDMHPLEDALRLALVREAAIREAVDILEDLCRAEDHVTPAELYELHDKLKGLS